jgi:hypothetical protein
MRERSTSQAATAGITITKEEESHQQPGVQNSITQRSDLETTRTPRATRLLLWHSTHSTPLTLSLFSVTSTRKPTREETWGKEEGLEGQEEEKPTKRKNKYVPHIAAIG